MKKHIELWDVCKEFVEKHEIEDRESALTVITQHKDDTVDLLDKIARLVDYYYGWEEENE